MSGTNEYYVDYMTRTCHNFLQSYKMEKNPEAKGAFAGEMNRKLAEKNARTENALPIGDVFVHYSEEGFDAMKKDAEYE